MGVLMVGRKGKILLVIGALVSLGTIIAILRSKALSVFSVTVDSYPTTISSWQNPPLVTARVTNGAVPYSATLLLNGWLSVDGVSTENGVFTFTLPLWNAIQYYFSVTAIDATGTSAISRRFDFSAIG